MKNRKITYVNAKWQTISRLVADLPPCRSGREYSDLILSNLRLAKTDKRRRIQSPELAWETIGENRPHSNHAALRNGSVICDDQSH